MKKIIFCIAIIASVTKMHAQDITVLKDFEDERLKKLTSFKTNYISELFQAAIDNDMLSYSKSNITFKSTLFGIKQLCDTSITIDNKYKKHQWMRNIEISSKMGMNAQAKINEVTPGFKWSIINKRDVSIVTGNDVKEIQDSMNAINKIQFLLYSPFYKTDDKGLTKDQETIVNGILAKFTEMSTAKAKSVFTELEKTKYFLSELEKNKFIEEKFGLSKDDLKRMAANAKRLDELVEERDETIKRGAILNLTGYGRYKDIYWDSVSIGLEFIKGLGNKKDEDKPWDLQASAFYNAKLATNLNNQTMSSYAIGKVGINKVLIKNKAGASLMEVLGAAEVNHAFEKPLEGDQTKILADFTLTLRINKTTFLPIEIKYDPKNANVFGYFKLKWDITSEN